MTHGERPRVDGVDAYLTAVLHNPDSEHIIATLGRRYVDRLRRAGKPTRAVLVVSNQRLYLRGKGYVRHSRDGQTSLESFMPVPGHYTVSLRHVTATGYQRAGLASALVQAVVIVVIGLISTVWLSVLRALTLSITPLVLWTVFAATGVCVYVWWRRRTYFVVEYAGGAIGVHARWFSASEIEDFRRRLSVAQDGFRSPG